MGGIPGRQELRRPQRCQKIIAALLVRCAFRLVDCLISTIQTILALGDGSNAGGLRGKMRRKSNVGNAGG